MFKVKSTYRRYWPGFGLAYDIQRFDEPDLESALARIQSELQRDDIKEVSIEDSSNPMKPVTEYPEYSLANI